MAAIAPGQIIGTTVKTGVSFQTVAGQAPTGLMDVLTAIIQLTAHITKTPASRFSEASAPQSGESRKEQERPLTAKVRRRKTLFGNAWEDVIDLARKLDNLYGNAGLDETLPFSCEWEHAHTFDELLSKRDLGIPQEQLWAEMGYTQDEIKAMKNMDEVKNKQAAADNALAMAEALSKQPPAAQPVVAPPAADSNANDPDQNEQPT